MDKKLSIFLHVPPFKGMRIALPLHWCNTISK